MSKDARWPAALHEAGHCGLAWWFGWQIWTLTCVSGASAGGCMEAEQPRRIVEGAGDIDPSSPPAFTRWAPGACRGLEERVIVAAAGRAAELVLLEDADVPALPTRPIETRRLANVSTAGPGYELRAHAAELVNSPDVISDWLRIEKLGRMAHGDDRESASRWTFYLRAQAARYVRDLRPEILRLADRLYEVGTLSGDQAISILTGSG